MTTYGVDRDNGAGGSGSSSTVLLADGSVPLTADWNVGAQSIGGEELRIYEPGGPSYVSIAAPSLAANVLYTMPAADALVTGYVLSSNAAGVLSWQPSSSAGGSLTLVAQTGHGLSVGNLVRHNGTNYVVADKGAASTADVAGIVQAVTNADNFVLQTGGYIATLSGLTAGTVYFLGASGALTATEPSTVGEVSKPVLLATTTTAGVFVNMRGSVVGTASSTLSVENFSGDGADTTFTLASSPLENNTFVMVEGVYQQKNTYSISGTTLTFTTAPPTGTNNIEVVTVGSVNIGTPSDNTVTAAKIVDDTITETKLAAGATLQLGTMVASTSGTSIDFTSIPAGTKQITVMFSGLSTNGTSNPIVQIGDSGGVETTGYLGGSGWTDMAAVAGANETTGFAISAASWSAAQTLHGTLTLTLMDAATFKWVGTFVGGISNAAFGMVGAGSKALSAELDRIRITTVGGTDTFDAGNVNIAYK